MNILLVTADFYPSLGGVANFNQGLAESLNMAGHRAWVLTPYLSGVDDATLPYKVIRYIKTKRLANLWPSLITFYLSLIYRFDVILYGHAASTISAGGILARKLNLSRLAVLTHGNDLDYAVSCKLDQYFLKSLLSNADIVFANSRYTMEKVLNRYPNIKSKLNILNPGVWPDRICPKCQEESETGKKGIEILTVARLVPVKGVEDLINAFALVAIKHFDAVLKIIGDGPDRNKLEKLAKQLKLDKKIIFAGAMPANQVYAEMRKCSFFIMSSKVETFGIAYLEANACGKAVIGTRQGGVPDAVIDGVTGLLVEPGNIQQLADAMMTLIEVKELRNKLGQAGKARVEKEFNWTMVAKRLETYITDIK